MYVPVKGPASFQVSSPSTRASWELTSRPAVSTPMMVPTHAIPKAASSGPPVFLRSARLTVNRIRHTAKGTVKLASPS